MSRIIDLHFNEFLSENNCAINSLRDVSKDQFIVSRKKRYLAFEVKMEKAMEISKKNQTDQSCPLLKRPFPFTSLHGYIDHFDQDISDYPTKMDMKVWMQAAMETMLEMQYAEPDPIMKFLTITLEPFVFTIVGKNGFTVWGPIYSLFKEAAKYINYR